MQLIKNGNVFSMFTKGTSLIITDEDTIDRIIDNPTQSLTKGDDRGFSQERVSLYDEGITLVDICKKGKENGSKLLSVSYDYFFGGSSRLNYPSDNKTLKAFKIIHDMAKEYGMGFSASIVSPLDVGGGYAKENDNTGYTCQYVEGKIDDDGEYKIPVTLQTQWLNNKGPIKLEIERIFVYAFNEDRIEDTSLFYVNPQNIIDISEGVSYKIDKESITISNNGYGQGEMQVYGKSKLTGYNRCFAVIKYRTPELDYFSDDVLNYMKSIIDMHNDAGIEYSGFYSDEMHIQFDWDLFNHFGDNEINTRYLSDSLIKEYAKRYGCEYQDFYKYMIYFAYHQHDFLSGKDAIEPSQHVFGKNESSIYKTWQFRKRYFEMLQRQVVDLCVSVKEYAQDVYSRSILTKAHSTWQESPTCDRFYKDSQFSEYHRKDISKYDYTPNYYWSSSIRENIAACYDYFKWNEYLTGGGTDHPEGGFTDRNYYSQAFACSLGVLNNTPIAYNGNWGSPIEVLQRLRYVATTYGNIATLPEHNLVQGLKTRESEVLAVYPLDLNYVEERFGS